MNRQIFKDQLLALILENLNFFQIKKIFTGMILVQKIIPIIVVNFQITNIDADLMCCLLLDLSKNIAETSRDDTPVGVSLSTSSHGEGFSGTCLAVSENCAVVSLKTRFDDIFCDFIKNWFLTS